MTNILLPIHETFQQTIQGEGYHTGTPVDFIRLNGCPVGCHFCDTNYADGGKNNPRSLISKDALDVFNQAYALVQDEKDLHKDKAIALGQVLECLAADFLAR